MRATLSIEGAATRLDGPLLFARRTVDVGLNSAVEVVGRDGQRRLGRVAALDEAALVLEVLESTHGLGSSDTRVILRGEPLQFAVGPGILGRVFNGVGKPIDGGPRSPPSLSSRSTACRSIPWRACCRAISSRPASRRSIS